MSRGRWLVDEVTEESLVRTLTMAIRALELQAAKQLGPRSNAKERAAIVAIMMDQANTPPSKEFIKEFVREGMNRR